MENKKEIRILMAAGGTGGHLYPAMAIASELLKNPGVKILFVGTKGGIEEKEVLKRGIAFESIPVKKYLRRNFLSYPSLLINAVAALFRSASIARRFRPDAAVGIGGYVSGPVLLASALIGIPSFIHEQNTVAGLTNRILGRFVSKIGITFEMSRKYFPHGKVELTGNPVRDEILSSDRNSSAAKLGIDPGKRTVLIFGGSRGAKKINIVAAEAAKALAGAGIQVLHVSGREDYALVKSLTSNQQRATSNYYLYEYLDNIWDALAVSDLVICRAGATSIAELTATGVPSILIPYPYAADNHQFLNASVLAEKGAAEIIADPGLTEKKLSSSALRLINDPASLKKMSEAGRALGQPGACKKIAEIILQLAENKS